MTFDPNIYTPYSTILPLLTDEFVGWAPELEQERIASYQKYDEIYWSHPKAFKLEMRGDYEHPIYVPNARQIVDSTAHFLMANMNVVLEGGSQEAITHLNAWLVRENFYGNWGENKLAGVTRGDYLLHLRANPTKPEGTRVSISTVDPASWFPIFDPLDPDKLIGIQLVEQMLQDSGQVLIRKQEYRYEYIGEGEGQRRVVTSEMTLVEVEYWWDGARAKTVDILSPLQRLDERIDTIPVFAFKNIGWQGQYYGSSELRGYERLLASINQSVTDEELALALDGLGVYATDAGHPVDEDGNEVDWEIAPGRVIEHGGGASFNRVSGVGSIKPSQDHIGYLTDALYESAATFRPGQVDVQLAESGVALAIKFLPTLAKLDLRETFTVNLANQFWHNWRIWTEIYEQINFGDHDPVVELGEKLPTNKAKKVEELNNMLDRNVISRQYYRDEMEKLGYVFPPGMEDQILKELEAVKEAQMGPQPDEPNNKNRTNESDGTEVDTEE